MSTKTLVATVANLSLLAFVALGVILGGLSAESPEQTSGLYGPANPAVQMQRENVEVNAPSVETFTGTLPAGCTAEQATDLSDLAVVRMDGSVERMTFGEAAARGESKNKADDVWVVGTCK